MILAETPGHLMNCFIRGSLAVACVAIGSACVVISSTSVRAAPQKTGDGPSKLRARAEQGDPEAQFNLGRIYYHGQGVPENYDEAARWMRRAADQGYANAQYALGVNYFDGKGVPQDNTEAMRWFRKAAEQGYADAENALGFMYYRGKGVPQDSAEAVRWWRKAAEQGDATGQRYLGFSYAEGRGVAKDHTEAVRWYRKAADQGDAKAQHSLEVLYREQRRVFLEDSTSIAVVVLAVLILLIPDRRWGRATWLPSAITSGLCAAMLIHEVTFSGISRVLSSEGVLGPLRSGTGRILFVRLLACGAAGFAFRAAVEAARAFRIRSRPAG